MGDRADDLVRNALAAADSEATTAEERADMLVEIAVGLQQRPKSPDQVLAAIQLYDRALDLCASTDDLTRGRIVARKATALQILPGEEFEKLVEAREHLETALLLMKDRGTPEEIAEAEMNLGLCIQTLAGAHRAKITDAISAYQRSLRTFDKAAFPKEFAILQNNLATAFLSIPFTDQRARMREALAVQAFEEGLKVVNLIDHPTEYAMLQNNLGNALQYASSSHTVENNLRALDAYEEALKVRGRDNMPTEYANTISNLANCLLNLPDDPAQPETGNFANLRRARSYYREAREIFSSSGENDKARIVGEAVEQIERELMGASDNALGRSDGLANDNYTIN